MEKPTIREEKDEILRSIILLLGEKGYQMALKDKKLLLFTDNNTFEVKIIRKKE